MKVQEIMQSPVTTVDEGDPLALAMQLMLWTRVRHLPVMRRGSVVGIISERDLLTKRATDRVGSGLAGVVADVMSTPARTTFPGADVQDVAAVMNVDRIGCLPVVDEARLVGIITLADLLAQTAQMPVETTKDETRIASVMSRHVHTCEADDALLDAAAKMAQYGVRHLPVVDGRRVVVGILSDRDVRSAVGDPTALLARRHADGRVSELRVSAAMTRAPRTVRETDALAAATQLLAYHRFGAIPVVDEREQLVGIVSYVDVLRACARMH